jgi:hypothetical protein
MIDNWRRRLSQLPGQFVLSHDERPPFPDWVSTSIGAYTLHVGPRTKVEKFTDRNREVFVIGVIAAAENEAIDKETCPAGQYVAITQSEVFSDAGSLKQAFFDRTTRAVASSPRLLAPPGAQAVSPELLHGSRPDWYWGPRTSFPNIDFLLPSQWLDLQTFMPKFRGLPKPSKHPPANPAKVLERELSKSLKRLASSGNPIRLAMTGGIDSRTLFAIALRTGIRFETYTMASPHVHPLDVTVARKISDRFGIRHSILRVGRIDRDELEWYLWFSAGQSVTLDSDFHAAGLWRQFRPDTIHIRGLGFELGRHKYRDFIEADDDELVRTNPIEIWNKFTRPWVRPLHRYNREAFETYARWLEETLGLSDMDFRDRLYLEQGIGTWCASAEYALGATAAHRISIGNSAALYNLFVREGSGSKKSGPLQREMMAAIDPAFLDYPFAKPTPAERLRFRALDTLRALRLRRLLRRLR